MTVMKSSNIPPFVSRVLTMASSAVIAVAPSALIAYTAGCRGSGISIDESSSERSAFSAPSVARDRTTTDAAHTVPKTIAAVPTVQKMNAELGQVAPNFRLPDLQGNAVELASFRGKVVVLEWFSPMSADSIHAWSDTGPLRDQTTRAMGKGVVWLTIVSQGIGHASSDVEVNRRFALEHGIKSPMLMDADGVVGHAYGAKSTPHMFVINEKGVLVYRGALDSYPQGVVDPARGQRNYVDDALNDMRAGHAVSTSETPLL